jgi:hypothetical protein
VFGEKLRQQVEDRLKFYETGEIPRKNIDVMKEAVEEVQQVRYRLTHYMIQGLSLNVDSCMPKNLKIHCNVHKALPLVPILSHLSPVATFTPISQISISILSSHMHVSQMVSCIWFCDQDSLMITSMHAACPTSQPMV